MPGRETGSPRLHELKTWPGYWPHVATGIKTFEVRRDDGRDFREGDLLRLREWDPGAEQYTGRECERQVAYILPGDQFGIEPGFVVMGLVEVVESGSRQYTEEDVKRGADALARLDAERRLGHPSYFDGARAVLDAQLEGKAGER